MGDNMKFRELMSEIINDQYIMTMIAWVLCSLFVFIVCFMSKGQTYGYL